MLKKEPGYFTLIGEKSSSAARNSSEVARKNNVVILTPETAGTVSA